MLGRRTCESIAMMRASSLVVQPVQIREPRKICAAIVWILKVHRALEACQRNGLDRDGSLRITSRASSRARSPRVSGNASCCGCRLGVSPGMAFSATCAYPASKPLREAAAVRPLQSMAPRKDSRGKGSVPEPASAPSSGAEITVRASRASASKSEAMMRRATCCAA